MAKAADRVVAKSCGPTPVSPETVCDAFASELRRFGFEYFVFASESGRRWRSAPWSRVPMQLRSDYIANHVFDRDPALALSLRKRGLCSWHVPHAGTNDYDPREFGCCMAANGFTFGFATSFVGYAASCDVISVLSAHDPQLSSNGLEGLFATISQFWHSDHELEWIEYRKRPLPILTPREFQVLRWMKEGKSYGDVATITGLSQRVIEFHARNILAKLDAGDRTTAVIKAIQLGLIPL
jgi:DNA-binding CsgD family transcriptional regulator